MKLQCNQAVTDECYLAIDVESLIIIVANVRPSGARLGLYEVISSIGAVTDGGSLSRDGYASGQ
jgi:hypothetical protein